jgi:hypothetical protein
LAGVIDDRSGFCYQEYHVVKGEDVMTALQFLFNAMSPKKDKQCPFQGIPAVIYMDAGPVSKSRVFLWVMKQLGVEVRVHMPKGSDGRRTTARSKGKVERSFLTIKCSLETLYHLQTPESLEEANAWLHKYLQEYNAMDHRLEEHFRREDWLLNCLVPHLNGVSYVQLKEEKRWDKYSTAQPRLRTLPEQKYKHLKRASAN